MCTYITVKTDIDGSAKAPGGKWFRVTDAAAYFDHPVHAMAEHTLNLDLTDPAGGPGQRIALELTAASAQRVIDAIQEALDAAPAALKE